MAEIPKVEAQGTGQVLRDRKGAVVAAKKELEANKLVLAQIQALIKQNQFYEREIDGARGRIFMLLVAQTRNAEVASSEEYLEQITSALDFLTNADKKAQKE